MKYWLAHPATGAYGIDCTIGRTYADEIIAGMHAANYPGAAGHAVLAFFADNVADKHGRYDGRIIGFCHRLSERAAFWPQSTAG